MIFISYAWGNKLGSAIASSIFEIFSKEKIYINKIFWDKDKNLLGDKYNDNIKLWIEKSSYFIFINSYEYENSIPCWKELHLAIKMLNEKKLQKIIEIKLDNQETPSCIPKQQIFVTLDNISDEKLIINKIKKMLLFDNCFINKTNDLSFSIEEKNIIYDIINKCLINKGEHIFLNKINLKENLKIKEFLIKNFIVEYKPSREDILKNNRNPLKYMVIPELENNQKMNLYLEWLKGDKIGN